MNDLDLAIQLVTEASAALRLKQEYLHKRTILKSFVRQMKHVESILTQALVPLFRDQIAEMVNGLRGIEEQKATADDQATALASIVFDPKEWYDKLVDAVLPILVVQMAIAARDFLKELGIGNVGKSWQSVGVKASTATEWLASHADDMEELEELFEAEGYPISLMTELPEGVKKELVKTLRQSFDQPYWKSISETTKGDAERVLKRGVQDGWSIRRMADEMAQSLGGNKYALTRATAIARTEAGGALNGARKGTMDALKADMPPEASEVLVPTWRSVLGDTTREDHASLDGVPADADGLWNLGGVFVEYPMHFSLPPEQRVNCQCTIIMEFGMRQDDAHQLLNDYAARQEA